MDLPHHLETRRLGYMFPIIGTIRSAVKLAELDNKWQQKKQKGGKAFSKEMDPMTKQIMQYKEDLEKMRENRELSAITAKVKAGEGLTPDEIEYLQKNNPQMYKEYMEVQSEKEAYERELKSCRTKDDVERLKLNRMSSFMAQAKSVMNNPNIPEGAKLALMEKILMKTMGVQKVHMKFVQSSYYKSLPTDEELAEETKEKTESNEEELDEIKPDEIKPNEIDQKETGQEESAAPEVDLEVNAAPVQAESSNEGKAVLSSDAGHKEAQDIYEVVKSELTGYIKSNRSSGYGIEYISKY